MDGFHVHNVQYLYEDQDLKNETLIPGKTGNVSVHKKHKKMAILTIVMTITYESKITHALDPSIF